MKKLCSALLCVMFVFLCWNPVSIKAETVIKLYPFNSTTGSRSYSCETQEDMFYAVTSGNEVWTATSDVYWIKITKSEGQASNPSLTFKMEKNAMTTSRKGTITIKAGSATATCTVYQSGDRNGKEPEKPSVFGISKNLTYGVFSYGQKFTITITPTVDWKATSNNYFIKFAGVNGSEISGKANVKRTFEVEVLPNDSSSKDRRVGTIYLSGGGEGQFITFTQAPR